MRRWPSVGLLLAQRLRRWPNSTPTWVNVSCLLRHVTSFSSTVWLYFSDVDDTVYPPQKKVFRMLQHMCSHHLSKYDWFIRADDDVYLKVDKLTKLLHTLDKTKKVSQSLLVYVCTVMYVYMYVWTQSITTEVGYYLTELLKEVVQACLKQYIDLVDRGLRCLQWSWSWIQAK